MLVDRHRSQGVVADAGSKTTATATPAVWVEQVHDLDQAQAYVGEWQALADRAVEKNIFYEPWNLLAALATIARSARVLFLFVFAGHDADRRLVGFFPLERLQSYRGLPVRRLRLLRHVHCFLCTPLVDGRYRDDCLAGFARWVAARGPASMLMLGAISSTLRHDLERHLRAAGLDVTITDEGQRALFRPRANADTYLAAAMSTKARKELRRKERRLAETGMLELRSLQPDDDARPWIRDFLELEQQGWKGRAGTALGCSAAERAYFEAIAQAAHRLGRLTFVGYFLDGRPVALSCKFRAGDGVFAFKITFDEDYARYSPGMLLELSYIVRAHDGETVQWMDSCAEQEHAMANRLWMDRIGIDTLVATSGGWGRAALVMATAMRQTWHRLRTYRRGRTLLEERHG